MKHVALSVWVIALIAGAAFAQTPTLTSGEIIGPHAFGSGNARPQAVCWYNGDLDYRQGFACDRNTLVTAAWTFDDVDWEGGKVTGFLGQFITNANTTIVATDIIVYRGMGEGEFGTLMAEVRDVTDFTLTRFGWFSNQYILEANLEGFSFNLPPDTYHIGIRVVGIGQGQAFAVTTSGSNAVGSPRGNNGRSFLQSNFFGYPLPMPWENIIGPGRWDVSFGLVCDGGYHLTLSGICPGLVRIEWRGADSNRQHAILFSRNEGGFIIQGGSCAGTQLGLGAYYLQIYNTISTGNGAGSVHAATRSGACGGYVQLIQTHSCATSNVAQIP